MFKRTSLVLSLTLLLAILLTACGGPAAAPTSSGGSTDSPTTAAEEPTPAPTTGLSSNYDAASQQITVWLMPNGPQPLAIMSAEVEAFVKANPDIGINYQLVDWGNAYTQIQTALQGGSDACVTQIGTTWVPGFSATGGLRPFAAEEIAAMGGESAFVPASWELTGIQGSPEVTAMPWFADVRAIAYRKDIFEQAGVDTTTAFKDLESFEAALVKIKDAGLDVAPFIHPGRNDWNVWQNASQFMWNFGGDILSADNTHAVFNSPEAVDGVHMLVSLYGKGLTPADALELNSAQAEQRFGNGEAASIIASSFMISQSRAPKDAGGWTSDVARANLAYAEFPAGPGGQFTFVGGSQLGIFKDCAHPEAAVKFVQYLTGTESQARYGAAIGMLPALKKAQDDKAFSDPLYAPFKSAAAKGKSAPAVVQWGGIENAYQTELQGLWEDVAASPGAPVEKSVVESRLNAAAETVDQLLEQ